MERRKFSGEFKREAVKLTAQPGTTTAQVARDLGVHVNVLRKWVKQFALGKWESTPGLSLKSSQQQEIERLKRELNRVRTERDILKKAVAYFAREPG